IAFSPTGGSIMSRADEGRLIHLAKRREREKEDIEQQKRKLEEDLAKTLNNDIDTKFTANYDALEETIKSKTIGLVTLEQMRDQQKNAVTERVKEVAQAAGESKKKDEKKQDDGKVTTKEAKKKPLSFAFDDEEEEDGEPIVIPKKELTQFAKENFECVYNLAAVLTKEDIERCYSLRQTPESDLLRVAIKSYRTPQKK
ncbi:hypothetical protein PENTCL1PPCAC_1390, partial [Pristionchus entomophagus]